MIPQESDDDIRARGNLCEDGQDEPLPNGSNGRDEAGRFVKGHKGGPGNPHAKRIAELKSAVLEAVSPADLKRVVEKLVYLATDGEDVAAAKVLMDRLFGKEIVAHVETAGGLAMPVLILPANGTEGFRARGNVTSEGE